MAWVFVGALGVGMQIVWMINAGADLREARATGNGRVQVAEWNAKQVLYRLVSMAFLLLAGIVSAWGAALGIPIEARAAPVILCIVVALLVGLMASVVLYLQKEWIKHNL